MPFATERNDAECKEDAAYYCKEISAEVTCVKAINEEEEHPSDNDNDRSPIDWADLLAQQTTDSTEQPKSGRCTARGWRWRLLSTL